MSGLTTFFLRHTALLAASVVDDDGGPAADAVTAFQEMSNDPWFVRHSLMVVVLLLILLVFLFFRWRRRPLEIFSNANGRIHVSPGALTDLVASAALDYGAVSRPRARFEKRKGQLHVHVWLKLGAGQKLPQFSNGLQTRIAQALKDAFGIEDLGGVHVVITGFKGEAGVAEKPSPVPYHGAAPADRAAAPRTDGDFFGSH